MELFKHAGIKGKPERAQVNIWQAVKGLLYCLFSRIRWLLQQNLQFTNCILHWNTYLYVLISLAAMTWATDIIDTRNGNWFETSILLDYQIVTDHSTMRHYISCEKYVFQDTFQALSIGVYHTSFLRWIWVFIHTYMCIIVPNSNNLD